MPVSQSILDFRRPNWQKLAMLREWWRFGLVTPWEYGQKPTAGRRRLDDKDYRDFLEITFGDWLLENLSVAAQTLKVSQLDVLDGVFAIFALRHGRRWCRRRGADYAHVVETVVTWFCSDAISVARAFGLKDGEVIKDAWEILLSRTPLLGRIASMESPVCFEILAENSK